MKIPKSFKLFGTKINILFDNKRMNNESCLGISEHAKNTITLTEEYKGNELSSDIITDTYYHEKIHTILDAMGETELSKNEKFIEVFSRLLRQSDETSDFNQ